MWTYKKDVHENKERFIVNNDLGIYYSMWYEDEALNLCKELNEYEELKFRIEQLEK